MKILKGRIHIKNIKGIGPAFFKWGSDNRNSIFVVMCALMHLLYFIMFTIIKVYPLSGLNIVSMSFYIYLFFSKKIYSQKAMAACYLEILLFVLLSTVCIHGLGGFVILDIGMIAAIFYLTPDFKVPRLIMQVFGLIMAIVTIIAGRWHFVVFPSTLDRVIGYDLYIIIFNICITSLMLIFATHLYTYELRKAQVEADFNVNHDYLTGLYNRRYFHQFIKLPGMADKPYIVVMGDIDNFKKINDVYGHDIGDEVLENISRCFQKSVRKTDMAVRWGGEEFLIFFPNTTMDKACMIMERIQNSIRSLFIPTKKGDLSVTMTFGVADKKNYRNYEDVIQVADLRMYYRKRNGKNCVVSKDDK